MDNYPKLTQLGITSPEQVSSYELTTFELIDTLRVRYTRQKGSFLPVSKRYQFPRRPIAGPQNTIGKALETDISPALVEVLHELDHLLANKERKMKRVEDIHNEINQLQEYINMRFNELKKELDQL